MRLWPEHKGMGRTVTGEIVQDGLGIGVAVVGVGAVLKKHSGHL